MKNHTLKQQQEEKLIYQIMDQYMEIEGARLLQEFSDAEAKGEVPDVPADLNAACRDMIRNCFEKRES